MNRPALAPAVLCAVLSLTSTPPARASERFPLELTVRSDDGKGIEGVLVTVTGESGEPFTVTGSTDRKGRFRTDLPDFERPYRIRAEREGLAALEERIDLAAAGIEPGQTAEVGLTMVAPTPAYYYEQARAALRDRDLPGAVEKMERSVALDASFLDGWRALGGLYLALDRPETALAAAEKALVLSPGDEASLRNRYDALAALERADELEAALEELIEKAPSTDTAVLVFNSGVEAMKDGEFETARRRFDQALAIDSRLHQAHSALAELHIGEAEKADGDEKMARLAEAVAELDRALAITPRNFNAWDRKVEVLKAMGRSDEAAELEKRVAELRSEG